MKVVVLTTSYPRHAGDVAGTFVRDGVEALRAAGVEVSVVSPADFRHFGIAYGDGIVNNLRRAPWKMLALPFFLLSFSAAARRAARDADLVHAHWLPSGLAALATGKPVVLQPWGSDVALAERMPFVFRPVVRRARVVVCASRSLADAARLLGGRDVRVVPHGTALPELVVVPVDPPHVLYLGRLSPEKGVADLAEAAAGLPLVVVGDGPLRHLLPATAGLVPPAEVGAYLDRAAVVVVPSRREGVGMSAREALAHGRPVVATAVGGLPDVVTDGITGLLVPPADPKALRSALVRILGDDELRRRLGVGARELAERELTWSSAVERLLAVYREAATLPH